MALAPSKLKNLILYICCHPKVKTLGLTKLYKLIYFADAAHLRDYGESITGSEYIKYEHGPVPSRGEKYIKELKRKEALKSETIKEKERKRYEFTVLKEPDLSVFSASEIEVIDQICSEFGKQTAKKLSDLSHEEPAWALADMKDKLDSELMLYGSCEDSEGL